MDQWLAVDDRCQDTELRGSELRARAQHWAPLANVLAGVADVLARVAQVSDDHPVARRGPGVFLADHRIRALGQRRPGENPRRLARADRPPWKFPRRDRLDDTELDEAARQIGGAAGVAVHRRI